jgi:hypothetical protein
VAEPALRTPRRRRPIPVDAVHLDLDEGMVWVVAGIESHGYVIGHLDVVAEPELRWRSESGAAFIVRDIPLPGART